MDCKHRIVTQAVGVAGIVDEPDETFIFSIHSFALTANQLVESAARSDPKRAGAVFINRPNSIVAEAMRILRVIDKMGKLFGGAIEAIEAAVISSDPKHAGVIFANGLDAIVAEAVGILPVIYKTREFPGGTVELVKPAAVGSDPKRVPRGGIFVDSADAVGAEAVRVSRVVDEMDKAFLIALELVEPFLSSNPERARAVFEN